MKEQGFQKKEEQQRKTNNKIEKAHYKFFYEPLHKTGKNEEGKRVLERTKSIVSKFQMLPIWAIQ